MKNFKDLEIYKLAFELAVKIHHLSLQLPAFEKYEQGSQIRRSSKSVKDQIAEGYGRRKYKQDFIKFLIYAQASCDECSSQLDMIITLYPEQQAWLDIKSKNLFLGKQINRFIQYVESEWLTRN